MTRAESKYFHTAQKMDEAFLSLLGKKDFDYITVKEICETAGVNRSTFYLHYQTINDLLSESVKLMNEQFLRYFENDSNTTDFPQKIQTAPTDELYLMTPKYLSPYLAYIRDHKVLFKTAIYKARDLRMDNSFALLSRHILYPILDRYKVPEGEGTT